MESFNSKKIKVAPGNGGMAKISREEISSLVHRREQKDFKFPRDFEKIDWGHIEFLAWKHPSGHKGYLVEMETGKPRLWVLECDTKPSTNKTASMCSLCLTVKTGSSVKIFSYRPDNNRNMTIGYHFCSELDCVDNVNSINPNSMRETISPERKRERMVENLHEILSVWNNANQK